MPYLIDTDWIIQALARRRNAHVVLHALSPSGLAVNVITLAELYEGAFGVPDPQAELQRFRRFLSPFVTLGLDDPVSSLNAPSVVIWVGPSP